MFNEFSRECFAIAEANGFHKNDPTGIHLWNDPNRLNSMLMLAVGEISEASEAIRHDDVHNFAEEIADVFIRLGDTAYALGISLDLAISEKMEKNRNRPYKHGGKRI